MLLTIWTKTEDNQIDKAELHLDGGGGAIGNHINFNSICLYSCYCNNTFD